MSELNYDHLTDSVIVGTSNGIGGERLIVLQFDVDYPEPSNYAIPLATARRLIEQLKEALPKKVTKGEIHIATPNEDVHEGELIIMSNGAYLQKSTPTYKLKVNEWLCLARHSAAPNQPLMLEALTDENT